MKNYELMRGMVAIDTETGGAGETECMTHALLSIGAYALHPVTGQVFTFHQLVFPRPGLIVSPGAVAVNGYSREKWIAGKAVEEDVAVIRFFSWLAWVAGAMGCVDGKLTALAHNSGHDRGFLSAAFGRYGLLEELEYSVLSRRWRCSCAALGLAQDAGVVSGEYGASLDALTALRTGKSLEEVKAERGVHAANIDARLCWEGYAWLLAQVKGEHKGTKETKDLGEAEAEGAESAENGSGNGSGVVQDFWRANYVHPELKVCCLCGNSGRVDTTGSAISPAGVNAGRLVFCICPNGREMKAAFMAKGGVQ